MKIDTLSTGLCSVALAIVLAGCHHKMSTVAPVEAPPKIAPPSPIASLTATPEAVERGAPVELSWNTQNATAVTIDGMGTVSASGSQKITPENSTTYHLTASGDGGSAEASARVTVNIPVVPGATEEELFAKNVKDIFFDYDRYDVRGDEAQTADSNAAFLAQHQNITLLIEGHCDERGSEEYNLGLGDSRASAVKDLLTQRGVNADRIKVISFGKERPFCTMAEDESCWSQNRRAHFVFESQHTHPADKSPFHYRLETKLADASHRR